MDFFAELSKSSTPSSSIKKTQFIQSADGANFLVQQIIFPMIKRKPNFPQPFLFRNGLLEFPVFHPNMLNSKLHFFPFGICWFDCGKNFHVFGINGFDGNLQIRFHTIFGFFNTFYWNNQKQKKIKNHSFYYQTDSDINKSQGRPKRTQRE